MSACRVIGPIYDHLKISRILQSCTSLLGKSFLGGVVLGVFSLSVTAEELVDFSPPIILAGDDLPMIAPINPVPSLDAPVFDAPVFDVQGTTVGDLREPEFVARNPTRPIYRSFSRSTKQPSKKTSQTKRIVNRLRSYVDSGKPGDSKLRPRQPVVTSGQVAGPRSNTFPGHPLLKPQANSESQATTTGDVGSQNDIFELDLTAVHEGLSSEFEFPLGNDLVDGLKASSSLGSELKFGDDSSLPIAELPPPPLLIADVVSDDVDGVENMLKPSDSSAEKSITIDIEPSVSGFRPDGREIPGPASKQRRFSPPARSQTRTQTRPTPATTNTLPDPANSNTSGMTHPVRIDVPQTSPNRLDVPNLPSASQAKVSSTTTEPKTVELRTTDPEVEPPSKPQVSPPDAGSRRSIWGSSQRLVAEPNVVITRKMRRLQPEIAKTLRFYYGKPLNTKDDSAWSIMHSLLGYGENTTVAVGGPNGRNTNAVGWMCWNNQCAGRSLLYLDQSGYITGHEGPGVQGHPCQFLAMLAQINLRRDYPLRVNGAVYKIEDLVDAEMRTCEVDKELTFKLIALSHYLASDARWKNARGEAWDLRKILNIELSQPVNGAACGGTHRVMAISYAVRMREMRGEPLDGIYARAQRYVRDYHRYAMSLRNRDGSFSSDWFKHKSDWGDQDRKLQTTGHMLEWLVYSLPRNELSDPRIVESVEFLSDLMIRHRHYDWEVGPRGHALRALSLYQQRVFMPQAAAGPVASRSVRSGS